MRGACAGCGARFRRGMRVRWLGALLLWGMLLVLALARLQTAPAQHARPAPPARLLVQSEPTTSTPSFINRFEDLIDFAIQLRYRMARLRQTPASHHPYSRVVSEAEQREEAERRLPSLSLIYWRKLKSDKDKFYTRKECAPFPSIYKLKFHNTYWQTMRTVGKGTFHLYGAYLDTRPASRIGPSVKILAVHDRIKPTLPTHCQLWSEELADPIVIRNLKYKYVWDRTWGYFRDGMLQPYLLACVLPPELRTFVPAAISLVDSPCERATNLLRVHYDRPQTSVPADPNITAPGERKEFAVCVKGLDFLHEDLSLRLVEWIELIKLLGADKIFFYKVRVHPNMTKVLKHYEERGVVTVTPIRLPDGQSYRVQMELIPYNDCLYRHMYQYRWLALLDVDEVIVPLEDGDWSGMMKRVLPLSKPDAGKPPPSSFHASNLYYLDSLQYDHSWEEAIPRYMHMLQHVYRTRNFSNPGDYVKAFHDTDRVLTLHNHFPLACLGWKCSSYSLPTEIARLQHYRAGCVDCAVLRAQPVRDTTLWRWRDPLVRSVEAVLQSLGFLLPPALTPSLPPHRWPILEPGRPRPLTPHTLSPLQPFALNLSIP